MNAQFYARPGGPVETIFGQPLTLHRFGGEFAVLEGRVWLTRRGDPDDHVLDAGQRIVLEPGDAVVVEPWRAGESARVRWKAAPPVQQLRRLARAGLGAALRGVAGAAAALAAALRRAEAGVEALGRGAAALARSAQGCIAGAPGCSDAAH